MKTYKVTVDDYGTKCWYNEQGQLHNEHGPACEYANGNKEWWLNDKLHREDGPAVEWASGSKWWCLNGKCHREGGPAVERANGSKLWYLNGKCHREDGPAVEWADGTKQWYLNGKCLTEAEYNAHAKKQPTCDGRVVEIDGKKYRLQLVP